MPTAMAAADLRGGATGKELMASLAAGAELMSRIGASLAAAQEAFTESKPQPTQMPGYFAAALSASRMLGLTVEQTHSALGLAFMQASGGPSAGDRGSPGQGDLRGVLLPGRHAERDAGARGAAGRLPRLRG